MNDPQEYYLKGYAVRAFRSDHTLEALNRRLCEVQSGALRPGFVWEVKYKNTRDLRPSVFEYDDVFVDILIRNDIPSLLRRVTGLDLTLAHIQLRQTFPGKSYMDWHRDTHFHNGKVTGNLPPVHKLIFYPRAGTPSRPKLAVIPGSHRRMFNNRWRDLAAVVTDGTRATISSSDDGYILFDTSLQHAVIPETDPGGSLRVIWEFCRDFQLETFGRNHSLPDSYRARAARG